MEPREQSQRPGGAVVARRGLPTKTVVLEVRTTDADGVLSDLFEGGSVSSTDDASLHRAQLDEGEVWIDQLDSRFWSFHTDMPAQTARSLLHQQVQRRRDLDWLWWATQHLDRVSRDAPTQRLRTNFANAALHGGSEPGTGLKLAASGDGAATLLSTLANAGGQFAGALSLESVQVGVPDGSGGTMAEAVDRSGVFAASGNSLDTHLQFVRSVVRRYSSFVEALEKSALGWTALPDGGGRLAGAPVGLHFHEPIGDLEHFVGALFSSREPFRLWGVPRIEDGVAEIDAVDLHVGQRLRIDVGEDWMRIYLERGGCSNTVARMISNLPHRFDSRLSLADPALQAAMETSTF